MKKTLLALASCTVLCGAASAQSSITLFGVVDRDVDIDVDVDHDWNPVATVAAVAVTAAVVGSIVNTLPPSGCYPVQIGPTLYNPPR